MNDRGRYRKVYVRMWGDERFCRLSKPKPNAQTLFFYLLTGPHTTVIPGLFVAGEASLAEALGWPVAAYKRCFAELESEGMARCDRAARVIWLPKAVYYNPPESPNVVRSWSGALRDDIPECALKDEAVATLAAFIEGLGDAFRKAWREAIPKPSGKGSPNQEQEQEQDLLGGTEAFTADDLQAVWNTAAEAFNLRACLELNTDRRRMARERLREKPSRDYWLSVITRITTSSFCRGQNDRGWIADFDFLVRKATHLKALEGKYDDRKPALVSVAPKLNKFTASAARAASAALIPERA